MFGRSSSGNGLRQKRCTIGGTDCCPNPDNVRRPVI
ncbi:hypothetical protein BDA96_03G380600 [Sorghum bicolor]|uniref:Uncharacterized protein n=1 Tax=Sorghum bicolor TaxID=4558 RepID=A0A921RHW2_SORBI|nr:hypothetical protein BDA96_03G380600 [Sorghum bicolor]